MAIGHTFGGLQLTGGFRNNEEFFPARKYLVCSLFKNKKPCIASMFEIGKPPFSLQLQLFSLSFIAINACRLTIILFHLQMYLLIIDGTPSRKFNQLIALGSQLLITPELFLQLQ
jgi:hypothetical protein